MITDFSWSDKHNTYFVRDGGRWRKARVGDLDHANVAPGSSSGRYYAVDVTTVESDGPTYARGDRQMSQEEQDMSDQYFQYGATGQPSFVEAATVVAVLAVVLLIVVFVVALS